MKVLFVTSFFEYHFGGAELVMRNLRRALQRRGHQVDVLCLGGGPSPQPGAIWRIPVSRKLNPQTLKRLLLFLNNALFDRHFLHRIRALAIPVENYELIHCHDIHSVVWATTLAQSARKPAGLTLQENLPREFEAGQISPLLRELVQFALDRRDRDLRPRLRSFRWITTPSQRIAQNAARFLGEQAPPIHTFYSPFPEDFAMPETASQRTAGELRFLFMGRLSSEKGIDLLLDSFAGLQKPATLTVVGLEGPLQERVRQRAARDRRIQIRPPVPHNEIPQLLQQHDVVCCPSIWNDPLPGAVIEARLHGKVIVATDRGGIPEIVDEYPKAILSHVEGKRSDERVAELRAALAKAAEFLETAVDPEVERAFRYRFSPENFVEQFERLYAGSEPATRGRS